MKHKLNLFVIGFLIIISWYRIIFTTFISEGYYYFPNGFFNQKFPYFLKTDEGARLLFDIFKVTLCDNIFLYHVFLLITLLVLGLLFYFLVYKTTENRTISLISSILFTTNYWSLFEYLGMGAYQIFAQRMVWFLLLFPSFIFFIKYFRIKAYKYFIWSFLLYLLSLYLSYFSIFFLPFYFTYIIGFYIWKKKINRNDFIKISLMIIYPIATFVILYLDKSLNGGGYVKSNFIEFLFVKKEEIIDLIFRQLVILTIPSQISHALLGSTQAEYLQKLRYLYGPVLLLYLGTSLFIFKRGKHLIVMALSSLIFIPIVFILNIFLREDYMLVFEDGSRYMFVPSIGFTIFWGVFIYIFCKRTVLKVGVTIFLLYWVLMNVNLISAGIEKYNPGFEGTKVSLNYIKSISYKFSEDSIIIIPSVLGDYGNDYVKYFYGKKNNFIAVYFREWEKQIKRPFDQKKDFIIIYDHEKGIIDRTKEINQILDERKRGIYPDSY